MNTVTVRVEPAGIEFSVEAGQTVMAAATDAGLRWPTVCGGLGTCRTCFMSVEDDAGENLSPVEPWEQEGLDDIRMTASGAGGEIRLACQARPLADVVVRKTGVRALSAEPS